MTLPSYPFVSGFKICVYLCPSVAGLSALRPSSLVKVFVFFGFFAAISGFSAETTVKTEHFDRDPGWEGWNNRVKPKHIPSVTQDFGYRPAKVDGQSSGMIGGRVTRAARPAFYADRFGVKTLNDKLSASGTFALT